jgi:hypothetical protein
VGLNKIFMTEFDWAYKGLQNQDTTEASRRVDREIMAQLTPKEAAAIAARARKIRDETILPGEHRTGKLLHIIKLLLNEYINTVWHKGVWEARQREIDSWGPGEHAPLSEQWLPDDYEFPKNKSK